MQQLTVREYDVIGRQIGKQHPTRLIEQSERPLVIRINHMKLYDQDTYLRFSVCESVNDNTTTETPTSFKLYKPTSTRLLDAVQAHCRFNSRVTGQRTDLNGEPLAGDAEIHLAPLPINDQYGLGLAYQSRRPRNVPSSSPNTTNETEVNSGTAFTFTPAQRTDLTKLLDAFTDRNPDIQNDPIWAPTHIDAAGTHVSLINQ